MHVYASQKLKNKNISIIFFQIIEISSVLEKKGTKTDKK
jgi:hypothetical protein